MNIDITKLISKKNTLLFVKSNRGKWTPKISKIIQRISFTIFKKD